MPQINCENLTLGYEGKAIISGLSFAVERGDYLCIVGENGSGKTTLTKALLGLKAPLNGKISFADGLTRRDIGYLPQQTFVQRDFPATVWEIVLSGCQSRLGLRPFYNRADKVRAHEAMHRLDICHLADRCYRELSGGQQQRVLLARALSATKSLLLLDEPVAGLDPYATAELYRLIAELNTNDNITVIMVQHDMAATAKYASHVLHIGEEIFFGPCAAYLASPLGRFWTGGEAE